MRETPNKPATLANAAHSEDSAAPACATSLSAPLPPPPPLTPALSRMRQLAGELRNALDRRDLDLMTQAARLLEATQAHCHPDEAVSADGPRLIGETRTLLDECEALLTAEMGVVSAEISRLKQGRRALAVVRAHPRKASGNRLDARR